MNLDDKNILVTGGNGFLGKHVLKALHRHGYYPLSFHSYEHDLTNETEVEILFDNLAPHIVIHLASQSGGIGANQKQPADYLINNLRMGLNVIQACSLYNVEKLVQVGTVCAYPKFTSVPFKEEDIWNGYPEETNAPYGIAKRTLLTACQAYRQQYGLNAIYLIPINLYGPGDNFDLESSHVIPALIRKMVEAKQNGTDVTIWGSGNASREFLYVEDAAEAIVLATENYDSPEPVNIGCGKEIKISALVDVIAELINFKGDIIWDSSKPDGQPRRCLDVSRAKQFGFKAKTDFIDGLKRTINWYCETSKKL